MDLERIKKHFQAKYEFIQRLGSGGFADVYLAVDRILERKVAIKLLQPQHASDPETVKRFIQEARLYARLDHPNLISIYETGMAEGTAYIVMKYIKGETLKDHIKKDTPARLLMAPRVIEALSGVLAYIHENGIIHRDIKPANILIEEGGKAIYLADFGIARSVTSQTMTQSGFIMGTPYYISPEQIKGGKTDHRSDIYAFGATLYELVSGNPVFTADTSIEILYQHVNTEPIPLGKIVPEASKTIRTIITRCLEKKPDKRFQKASDIADVLLGRGRFNQTEALEKAPAKKFISWRTWLAAALVLVPLLIYFLTRSPGDPVVTIPEERGLKVQDSPKLTDTRQTTLPVASKPELETMPFQSEKKPGLGLRTNSSGPRPEAKDPPEKTEEQKPPAATRKGLIRFSSYPASEIYWNGQRLGDTTQVFSQEFAPGLHTFTFKIDGYQTLEQDINLAPGEERQAHQRFEPYGFLTVTAIPYARFFIDGQNQGENPLFEKKLAVGRHRIKAERGGFRTEEQEVEITELKKISIGFVLKKEGQDD